jgi:hypothetical protein
MSYYKTFVTGFAAKTALLLIVGISVTQTGRAQSRVNFSGEWKLNQSKSDLGGKFPLCIFGNDRMRSRTLRITNQKDFLAIDVASSLADGSLTTNQEKLIFDCKETAPTFVGFPRKTSAANWSADGKTMTVFSVRSFDENGKTADFRVTEIWKLVEDGNSISIDVTSQAQNGDHTMKLIYERQWAQDYRF